MHKVPPGTQAVPIEHEPSSSVLNVGQIQNRTKRRIPYAEASLDHSRSDGGGRSGSLGVQGRLLLLDPISMTGYGGKIRVGHRNHGALAGITTARAPI